MIAHSVHFVRAMNLTTLSLEDGSDLGLPEIPEYSHPEIMDLGE